MISGFQDLGSTESIKRPLKYYHGGVGHTQNVQRKRQPIVEGELFLLIEASPPLSNFSSSHAT